MLKVVDEGSHGGEPCVDVAGSTRLYETTKARNNKVVCIGDKDAAPGQVGQHCRCVSAGFAEAAFDNWTGVRVMETDQPGREVGLANGFARAGRDNGSGALDEDGESVHSAAQPAFRPAACAGQDADPSA